MSKDVELILLFGLAILYVLWAAVYLKYEKWKRRKAARNAAATDFRTFLCRKIPRADSLQ